MRILVTGAGGALGRLLRSELAGPDRELVLLDVAPQEPLSPAERGRIVTASVDDLDALLAAADGADAIIHLGGLVEGETWARYSEVNITGTWCVLEAARRAGVARVFYASSNHAVGFVERPTDPSTPPLSADAPPRPDSIYGVAKVASEALCHLYHDRHGIDVVCARIGSCRPTPNDLRCRWSWLSYPDFVRLVEASLVARGFHVVWGVSRNARRWWSLAEGEAIGFDPRDDAEEHLDAIRAAGGPDSDRLGGPYTARGFDAAART